MKFHSNYLNKDIELATTQVEGGHVMSHDAIEDFILNECKDTKTELSVEHVGSSLVVVKCTIMDANGRRVQALGETVLSTASDLGKQYPASTAGNRAFDKAAVRFLGLPTNRLFNDDGTPAERSFPAAKSSTEKGVDNPVNNTDDFDQIVSGGKYKGKSYRQILAEDPGYVKWIVNNNRFGADVFRKLCEQEGVALDG